ncbi:MAG: hypothetical protein FWF05_09535 [Oscillospiraceae bacterium]|nr:hypothetical protein [Oscillospiraceae bacterium]
MKKRLLAVLLCVCAVAGLAAFPAAAAEDTFDLNMGIQLYGERFENFQVGNVGYVVYTRLDSYEQGLQNTISGLESGTVVRLTASVNKGSAVDYSKYYAFHCWVDEKFSVLGQEPVIDIIIEETTSVYAVFKEIEYRVAVHLLAGSYGGDIVATDNNNLKIFESSGSFKMVSVFQTSSPTFAFVPYDGYKVYEVFINGEKISDDLLKAIVVNGMTVRSYTFYYIQKNPTKFDASLADWTIEATFVKINDGEDIEAPTDEKTFFDELPRWLQLIIRYFLFGWLWMPWLL